MENSMEIINFFLETFPKCLINKDVRSGGRLWLKNLKYIIQTNFKKIRITNQKTSNADAEISRLIEQRRIGDEPQNNLIEQEISQKIYEKNRSIILEQVGGMVDISSNLSRPRMWKIKQKVCPKRMYHILLLRLIQMVT